MDATTHVRVAETACLESGLTLNVTCHASGEHFVIVEIGDVGRIGFDRERWSNFKGSVLAVDRAIVQLRDKGLIFDFREEQLPEPQIPEQPESQEVRIVGHVFEKLTPAGPVRKECRTLTEIEEFARQ